MKNVDVIINVFGKPWQTLCTIKSLLKYSGNHIDKIYITEEKYQPYGDKIEWILDKIDNYIHYIPKEYYGVTPFKVLSEHVEVDTNRFSIRYQYGIEKSDKKYVFLTHNDILYTNDIIKNMLSEIDDCAGIGLIGQCWNCPAFKAGVCDSERFNNFKPTLEEITEIFKYPATRGNYFHMHFDKDNIMPMPECRLNEFACLIDRELSIKECYPNGNVTFFGTFRLDTGDEWFKGMCLNGYKFKNYDINKDSNHGYFSQLISSERNYTKNYNFFVSGYPTQLNENYYWAAEKNAEEYYKKNFI